ncbi:GDSL-type esterase/lipase family protein [Streptomyces celluloflavus]|uniref:GDSL-type esterase/lipase family protein n=1 Tax=Streptomyces celluloflavus TaxID=58344 RepID=UPI0036758887
MTTSLRLRAGGLAVALLVTEATSTGCGTATPAGYPRTSADLHPASAHRSPQPPAAGPPIPAAMPRTTAGVVVIIGASVSGGYRASPGADWPSELAGRLHRAGHPTSVVNASISATRLLIDNGPGLPSSLTREDRDALAVPGVGTIVLTDVINDIQQTPHQYDPAAITTGLRAFVATAHAKGAKVVGTTIPPYGGFERYEAAGEHCRRAVNDAIRHTRLFDGVLDFDTALKDPADPTRIRPAYDSGDHLHPNDAGHHAMVQIIDPARLTP